MCQNTRKKDLFSKDIRNCFSLDQFYFRWVRNLSSDLYWLAKGILFKNYHFFIHCNCNKTKYGLKLIFRFKFTITNSTFSLNLDPPKPLKYDAIINGRPFTEIFKFQPATRQLVEYLNNGSVVVQVIGKQYVRKSAVARHKGMHTRDLIKSDRGVFSKYVQLFAI